MGLGRDLCCWGINSGTKMLWVKSRCRCLKTLGTSEQWGYRKICTDLKGAVGLPNPGRGSGGTGQCFV